MLNVMTKIARMLLMTMGMDDGEMNTNVSVAYVETAQGDLMEKKDMMELMTRDKREQEQTTVGKGVMHGRSEASLAIQCKSKPRSQRKAEEREMRRDASEKSAHSLYITFVNPEENEAGQRNQEKYDNFSDIDLLLTAEIGMSDLGDTARDMGTTIRVNARARMWYWHLSSMKGEGRENVKIAGTASGNTRRRGGASLESLVLPTGLDRRHRRARSGPEEIEQTTSNDVLDSAEDMSDLEADIPIAIMGITKAGFAHPLTINLLSLPHVIAMTSIGEWINWTSNLYVNRRVYTYGSKLTDYMGGTYMPVKRDAIAKAGPPPPLARGTPAIGNRRAAAYVVQLRTEALVIKTRKKALSGTRDLKVA